MNEQELDKLLESRIADIDNPEKWVDTQTVLDEVQRRHDHRVKQSKKRSKIASNAKLATT